MEETSHLLQEEEHELTLEPASVGQRFVNHIIDVISFIVIAIGAGMFIGIILALGLREKASRGESMSLEAASTLQIFLTLAYLTIIFGYYTLMEKLSKGRTMGKLITKTKAVGIDGYDLTWKQAMLRSIIRFVPFEALSAFGGNPWHDQWTDTKVVKIS